LMVGESVVKLVPMTVKSRIDGAGSAGSVFVANMPTKYPAFGALIPEMPPTELVFESLTAAPVPSGLLKLPPLLSDTVPVTLEKVSTGIEPAGNETNGGKVPAPLPPGAGGDAWPAPKIFASPRMSSVDDPGVGVGVGVGVGLGVDWQLPALPAL